jgi:hypothetical protein
MFNFETESGIKFRYDNHSNSLFELDGTQLKLNNSVS